MQLASEVPKRKTGRKVLKETRHPVFRGVRSRSGNKWVCELRLPKKETRVWLGTYPTPEMAARAHDVASLAFRGESGCLNFADSAWRLPVPASLDPKDVRKAAAQAAEMFRPQSFPAAATELEAEECFIVVIIIMSCIIIMWMKRKCWRCRGCCRKWLRGFCCLHRGPIIVISGDIWWRLIMMLIITIGHCGISYYS
ncbi:Dehydration-responsive element-binding protein 1E [Linum grandiflorum]